MRGRHGREQRAPEHQIKWDQQNQDEAVASSMFPSPCRDRRLSRSIEVYRPPAVRLDGMSDGIGAVRRAERQAQQTVEWLGDNRVGVTRKSECQDAAVNGRKTFWDFRAQT
jgi:hypothetical protein